MTLLALHYDLRRGRFGRVLKGDKDLGRDASEAQKIAAMDLARELKLQQLRERIAHDDYRVDPQAVAAAIVERLQAGQKLEPEA